jgi:lipoprotein NlpD
VRRHTPESMPLQHARIFESLSRFASRVLSAAVLIFFLSACGHDPPRTPNTYTVKRGDTLYSIAWRHGVDYHDLAKWNGIGRDYAIRPGQVLRFNAPTTAKKSSNAKSPVAATTPAIPKPPVDSGPAIKWSWPVQSGTATLTTRPNGGQGLTIAGSSGQEIRSAATGRVVYTGTGLLGYGQLIIVKHSETYLSAYGHTKTILVREQEAVQAGQPIATMGEGPSGAPILYFEIRVNGRPMDPRPLLPTK